jgi:hypothetical protein
MVEYLFFKRRNILIGIDDDECWTDACEDLHFVVPELEILYNFWLVENWHFYHIIVVGFE